MKEDLYTKDCIRTFTGIYVNVFEPKPEMFSIDDIAHSLSMQCRFTGHLSDFYSVAQHCIAMSDMVHPSHQLAALLHDASEAYLLDIASPIKARIPGYKEIENNLMVVIAEKFGFKYPLHEKVKEVDSFMLAWEWERLMLHRKMFREISCMDSQTAEILFLERYDKYKKLTTDAALPNF